MANTPMKYATERWIWIANDIVNLAKNYLTRGVPTQLKLCETMHIDTLELLIKTSEHIDIVNIPKSYLVTYRSLIMTLVCGMLDADGYKVCEATTPMVDSVTHRIHPAQPQSPSAPSPSVVAAATVVPDRPLLSVASVRAMCDARDMEAEARRKAEQEELDRKTFQMLQRRIIDGKDLSRIEDNDKRGYTVFFSAYADTDWIRSMRRVIPLLQDAVGPSEKVTFTENPLGCNVTVMEI